MGNIFVMCPLVSVKCSSAPANLPTGLTGVPLAQVDLVFHGHVMHLMVITHFSAAEVAHESRLPIPDIRGQLWYFQVCLLPNLLIV